jgi:hypothetical protein
MSTTQESISQEGPAKTPSVPPTSSTWAAPPRIYASEHLETSSITIAGQDIIMSNISPTEHETTVSRQVSATDSTSAAGPSAGLNANSSHQETPNQEPQLLLDVPTIPVDHEMNVPGSSLRPTPVSSSNTRLAAPSTALRTPTRERSSIDIHGSPLSSRQTISSPAEQGSVQPDHSSTSLLVSTIDTQDGRGSIGNPGDIPLEQILRQTERTTWWTPWKITWYWLCVDLFITVSFIITILGLYIISIANQGFSPLWDPPDFLTRLTAFENNIWSQGVLYTSLPAFFMVLFNLWFSSTVATFSDLQPYVDLAKHDGAPAGTTIMLDYRRYFMGRNVLVAMQNRHYLLAYYMMLSAVMSIAVIPFTAFLMVATPVNLNTTAQISFTTAFNESSVLAIPDFGLVMDLAAAVRIYNANPPPWTDGEYAFPEVVLLDEMTTSANLTVETAGYSAYLDCNIIPQTQYNLTAVDAIGANPPAQTWQISSHDRGCDINSDFAILPKDGFGTTRTTVVKTWGTSNCGLGDGYSRLSIASGAYVQALTNFSLVSCIPSYWKTPGTLTTTTGMTGPPVVQSFSANDEGAVEARSLALYFELSILAFACSDPSSDFTSTNVYGRQIYSLASKTHPESPLLPEAIKDAAQILFTSIYAILLTTSLFQPISPLVNSTGVKSTNVTRLVIVIPMAWTLMILLLAVAVGIVTMFWYGRKPNILDEEPTGLVSSALILHDSTVMQLMGEVQRGSGRSGRLLQALEHRGLSRNTVVRVNPHTPPRITVPGLETELNEDP